VPNSTRLRDVAIVGIGATPYYKRGMSLPKTTTELGCEAILAACEDAGLGVTDIDGFAYYSGASAGYTEKMDTADFMETLGIPEVRFTAALTSGGGGSAGAIGLARAAIVAGDANVVVTLMALQQSNQRLGTVFSAVPPDPITSFLQPAGLSGPGHLMSVLARRHMHLYGTRREAFAEIAMSTQIGRERALQKAFLPILEDYDFICIDTPPSLGLLTINALTAADKVIVPVQCEYLSMRGLIQLQNTLSMIRENLNPDIEIEGILPTLVDSRTVHAKEAIEILEENFGDRVFASRIRKTVRFAEAPVKGMSVLKYDPDGTAAQAYRQLAEEVLENGKR